MKRWRRGVVAGRGAHRARATAVVEFAVVLPLLLTILFGIMEYGWIFMVRQTMLQASQQGCRMATLQTSQELDVQGRVDEVMQAAGLSGYTMTHTSTATTETVVVAIPYNDVSLMGGFFGTHDYDLVAGSTMRPE